MVAGRWGCAPSHELQARFVGGRDFRSTSTWRIAPAGETRFRDSAPEREDKATPTRPFSLGLDPVSFPGKRNGVERKSFSFIQSTEIFHRQTAVLLYGKNNLAPGFWGNVFSLPHFFVKKRGSPQRNLAQAWFCPCFTGGSVSGRSASPAPMALFGMEQNKLHLFHTAGLGAVRGCHRHTSCRRISSAAAASGFLPLGA